MDEFSGDASLLGSFSDCGKFCEVIGFRENGKKMEELGSVLGGRELIRSKRIFGDILYGTALVIEEEGYCKARFLTLY